MCVARSASLEIWHAGDRVREQVSLLLPQSHIVSDHFVAQSLDAGNGASVTTLVLYPEPAFVERAASSGDGSAPALPPKLSAVDANAVVLCGSERGQCVTIWSALRVRRRFRLLLVSFDPRHLANATALDQPRPGRRSALRVRVWRAARRRQRQRASGARRGARLCADAALAGAPAARRRARQHWRRAALVDRRRVAHRLAAPLDGRRRRRVAADRRVL